jgi:hypothetical protein
VTVLDDDIKTVKVRDPMSKKFNSNKGQPEYQGGEIHDNM